MSFSDEQEELRQYLKGSWLSTLKPSLVERWEVGVDTAYEELSLTRPCVDLRKLKLLADKHPDLQGVAGQKAKAGELYLQHKRVKGRFPHNSIAIATEASLLIDTALMPDHRKELFRLLPDALVERPWGKKEKHKARARQKLTRRYP